ncbi:hypothetical protein AKJ16_DCAP20802 [Drosera capensis]
MTVAQPRHLRLYRLSLAPPSLSLSFLIPHHTTDVDASLSPSIPFLSLRGSSIYLDYTHTRRFFSPAMDADEALELQRNMEYGTGGYEENGYISTLASGVTEYGITIKTEHGTLTRQERVEAADDETLTPLSIPDRRCHAGSNGSHSICFFFYLLALVADGGETSTLMWSKILGGVRG